MFAIFPLWARVLFMVAVVGAVWGLGDLHGHTVEGEAKDLELATQQRGFDKSIKAADDALIAANKRAEAKTGRATNALATAQQTAYNRGIEDGKRSQAEAARVAGLAAGRERVRVDAVCRPANAGGGRQLPNDPGPAAGGDGATATAAELSAGAAGRIGAVGKAADDEVADLRRRLSLAQDYARIAYQTCGNPTPALEPTTAEKRSVLKLGAPNPFDR